MKKSVFIDPFVDREKEEDSRGCTFTSFTGNDRL